MFLLLAAESTVAEHPHDWTNWAPAVQIGFATFAACIFLSMLGVLVWLMKSRRQDWREWMNNLLALNESTNKVLAANTAAFQRFTDTQDKLCTQIVTLSQINDRIWEKLLERPCIFLSPSEVEKMHDKHIKTRQPETKEQSI